MFKLDNNLLVELGLGALPVAEKNKMLSHIYETLELRVGMRLAQQMSDQQLSEFESFIDGDQEKARAFLDTHKSGWQDSEEYLAQKQEAQKGGVAESTVISEFAALNWLSVNFPDYKSVVADELELLKTEIKGQAPQIMAASMTEGQAAEDPANPSNALPQNAQQDDPQDNQPIQQA